MKHITKIQIMAFAVILIVNCLNLKSQDTASVIFSEVKIKTSAQCEMCKERIEKAMSKTEGVAKSDLDVDTKILTVHYDSVLINPEEIRKVISKTGYDADDVPANEKAYKKLPKCCQKPE